MSQLFNYKYQGKVSTKSYGIQPIKPTNGFTIENLLELKQKVKTPQDDLSIYFSTPLPNFGVSSKRPIGYPAPVTSDTLKHSGIRTIEIRLDLTQNGENCEMVTIEIVPLDYSLLSRYIPLFERHNGGAGGGISASIKKFDERYTERNEDRNLAFQPDFGGTSTLKTLRKIEKRILNRENQYAVAIENELLDPIIENIIDCSISELQKKSAVMHFVTKMVDVAIHEGLNSDQISKSRERFLHQIKDETDENHIQSIRDNTKDAASLNKAMKKYMLRKLMNAELVESLDISYRDVSEQHLRYYSGSLSIDFGLCFASSYESALQFLRFPGYKDQNSSAFAFAFGTLIEVKRECTMALKIVEDMMNEETLKKYPTKLLDLICANIMSRKSAPEMSDSIKQYLHDVNLSRLGYIMNSGVSLSEAVLVTIKNDTQKIDEFITNNKQAIKNFCYSINKLVLDGLLTDCNHLILSDYTRFLLIEIKGVNPDFVKEANLSDHCMESAAECGSNPNNNHDAPINVFDHACEGDLIIESFILNAQSASPDDRDAPEKFKFRLSSFLLDALEKFHFSGTGTEEEIGKILEKNDIISQIKRCILIKNAFTTERPAGSINSLSHSDSNIPKRDQTGNDYAEELNEYLSSPLSEAPEEKEDLSAVRSEYYRTLEVEDKSNLLYGAYFSKKTISMDCWFTILNVCLPNCITLDSRIIIHSSEKSLILGFRKSDASIKFLKSLKVPLDLINDDGDEDDFENMRIPDGHGNDCLVLKFLLIEPVDSLSFHDTESEDIEAEWNKNVQEAITRLTKEVYNLLKIRDWFLTGEETEKSNLYPFPLVLSSGYINDLTISVNGTLGMSKNYLDMISCPFILFEGLRGDQLVSNGHRVFLVPLSYHIIRKLTIEQKIEVRNLFYKLHNEKMTYGDFSPQNVLMMYESDQPVSDFDQYNIFELTFNDLNRFHTGNVLGFQLVDLELAKAADETEIEKEKSSIEGELWL